MFHTIFTILFRESVFVRYLHRTKSPGGVYVDNIRYMFKPNREFHIFDFFEVGVSGTTSLFALIVEVFSCGEARAGAPSLVVCESKRWGAERADRQAPQERVNYRFSTREN